MVLPYIPLSPQNSLSGIIYPWGKLDPLTREPAYYYEGRFPPDLLDSRITRKIGQPLLAYGKFSSFPEARTRRMSMLNLKAL